MLHMNSINIKPRFTVIFHHSILLNEAKLCYCDSEIQIKLLSMCNAHTATVDAETGSLLVLIRFPDDLKRRLLRSRPVHTMQSSVSWKLLLVLTGLGKPGC